MKSKYLFSNLIQNPSNFNNLDVAHTAIFSIKEAVAKALGLGLKINLKDIHLTLNEKIIKVRISKNGFYEREYYAISHYIDNYVFTLTERIQ